MLWLCVEISRFPPLCGVPSLGAIPHPILVVYESLKPSSLVSSGWFSPSFIFTLRCLFCFVESLSGNQKTLSVFPCLRQARLVGQLGLAQGILICKNSRVPSCLLHGTFRSRKCFALCQCSYWQPCGLQS